MELAALKRVKDFAVVVLREGTAAMESSMRVKNAMTGIRLQETAVIFVCLKYVRLTPRDPARWSAANVRNNAAVPNYRASSAARRPETNARLRNVPALKILNVMMETPAAALKDVSAAPARAERRSIATTITAAPSIPAINKTASAATI